MSALGANEVLSAVRLRSSTPGWSIASFAPHSLTIAFSSKRERSIHICTLRHTSLLTPFLVLHYLEGMSREGDEPDNTPPRSMVDPNEYRSKAGSVRTGTRSPGIYSPAPRSKNSDALLELANSPMSYTNRNGANLQTNGHDDDGDADSNVQDGLRSEAGETILPMVSPLYLIR